MVYRDSYFDDSSVVEDEKAIISFCNDGDMDGWMRNKYNGMLWTLG